MTQRVLLTGATGCVGRAALDSCLEADWEVHATLSPAGSGETRDPRVTWHAVDLGTPQPDVTFLSAVRPTHLLHLAWGHPRLMSVEENRSWIESSVHLLERFARVGGRRAVIAGTCAEYDYFQGNGVCSEDETPVRPRTAYANAKHELHSRSTTIAENEGIELGWARIFSLFGPGEAPQRLVASVCRSLLQRRPAVVTAGSQRRDFLYSADVARGLALLLGSDLRGPINIGSGTAPAVRSLVEEIAKQVGGEELLEFGALPLGRDEAPVVVADVTRAREALGFTPEVTIESGIAKTLAWWRGELAGSGRSVAGRVE